MKALTTCMKAKNFKTFLLGIPLWNLKADSVWKNKAQRLMSVHSKMQTGITNDSSNLAFICVKSRYRLFSVDALLNNEGKISFVMFLSRPPYLTKNARLL